MLRIQESEVHDQLVLALFISSGDGVTLQVLKFAYLSWEGR